MSCQNLSDKGNRQGNSEASSAFRPLPPQEDVMALVQAIRAKEEPSRSVPSMETMLSTEVVFMGLKDIFYI